MPVAPEEPEGDVIIAPDKRPALDRGSRVDRTQGLRGDPVGRVVHWIALRHLQTLFAPLSDALGNCSRNDFGLSRGEAIEGCPRPLDLTGAYEIPISTNRRFDRHFTNSAGPQHGLIYHRSKDLRYAFDDPYPLFWLQ